MIRCADAFGADAVILSEGSVDAYNSKAVDPVPAACFMYRSFWARRYPGCRSGESQGASGFGRRRWWPA